MSSLAELLAKKKAAAQALENVQNSDVVTPSTYEEALEQEEALTPTYWWHPESESLVVASNEDQAHKFAEDGCMELSHIQYTHLAARLEAKKKEKEQADNKYKPTPDMARPVPFLEIMKFFPKYNELVKHPVWNKYSLMERVHLGREYTKQAQITSQSVMRAAQETHAAQRQLEETIEKAEREEAARKAREMAKPKGHETFAMSVELNEEQQLGVQYATAGKCFVLTGPAGTGKTTTAREIARVLMSRGDLGTHTFKIESPGGGPARRVSGPGIAFVSYTRRATANIRRALHKDPELEKLLEYNVVTIHRLLEYEPEFYEEGGKNKMRFIPMRTAQRKLDCKVLVIEEASMLGLDLWEKLYAAMQPGTIVIFIGDINQLPPVFGKSIMNYALGQLPIVELKQVYRQAEDSGIITNAHRVLRGEAPVDNKDTKIITGKSPVHVGQEKMARALGAMFHELYKSGQYDPETDIILSPWNKQPCGTDNLNAWIAQFLGEKREAMVYEVFAGRRKLYLAVGDRVMYEKRDGIITKIRHNAQYLGKSPQTAGTDLTRFGIRKMSEENAKHEDFEAMANGYEAINIDEVPDEEKQRQASHNVELTLDDGTTETLSAIGDYAENVFSLGYALTVHKAQGCEWKQVFIVLHKDHVTTGGFLTRELVYTACTRAREKLVIISKPDLLAKAVKNQEIKGNTLAEKIQSINSGASNIGTYPVVKV